jgi:hypothetical protein
VVQCLGILSHETVFVIHAFVFINVMVFLTEVQGSVLGTHVRFGLTSMG